MGWWDKAKDKAKDIFSLTPPPPTETQAILADYFDRVDYSALLEEVPQVQRHIDQLDESLHHARDFSLDMHSAFHKGGPILNAPEVMAPTHVANRGIVEQLLDMPEVKKLRQHTVGDRYCTAMAMVGMTETAIEVANKAYEAAEEAAKAEEEARQEQQDHAERMQALMEAMEGTEDPKALDWLGQQLDAEMDQFGQQQAQADQFRQEAQQQARATGQALATEVRSAAKKVDEQLEAEKAMCAAFGVDDGTLKKMDVKERMALAATLRDNRLAKFIKLIGQFKAVQQAHSRRRVVNAADELHGVTQSNRLERMLPGEYLNFADPVLETLMWVRFASGELYTHDVRGIEKLGQGPIIVVNDESQSMEAADVAGGTREAWSKALALAMLDQARRRGRDFWYIGFASPGQQHVIHFPKGEADISKVLAMTEHFFCGGTHYEKPLTMALDIIEREYNGDPQSKGRPDIVFISDDLYTGGIPESFLSEYRRVKAKASIQTYGIALGCSVGTAMAAVCDNVRSVTELVSDPRTVGDLFSTI